MKPDLRVGGHEMGSIGRAIRAGLRWMLNWGLAWGVLLGIADIALGQAAPNVTVQTGWPMGSTGYYHVKAKITDSSGRPAPRNRRYWIVLRQQEWSRDLMLARQPVVLEAGQISTEVEISVPVVRSYEQQLQVIVNATGDDRPGQNDLFRETITLANSGESDQRNVLWISRSLLGSSRLESKASGPNRRRQTKRYAIELANESQAPAIKEIAEWYQDAPNVVNRAGPTWTNVEALNLKLGLHAVAPEDLPHAWSGLGGIELALISAADLDFVRTSVPDAFSALVGWVAAGGRLVVTECGANWEQAEQVRASFPGSGSRRFRETHRWRYPAEELMEAKRLSGLNSRSGFTSSSSAPVTISPSSGSNFRPGDPFREQITRTELRRTTSPVLLPELPPEVDLTEFQPAEDGAASILAAPDSFVLFPYLQGFVFCVKDGLSGWRQQDWVTLFNASVAAGELPATSWPAISAGQDAGFAIPGVGQPPVRAFLGLLTVFLLLVGPVTYMVLQRRRRLQWMFLVVPLISAVCCISLLSWAIVSEGFQLRGRARAFTDIDHAIDQAVTHQRYSLYAAIQPSDYRFANGDYVVECAPARMVELDFGDEDWSYSGGNVRPRMPHQFVAVRRHPATGGLFPIRDPDGEVRVENRFAEPVAIGMVRVGGKYYQVADLPAGETVTAEPLSVEIGKNLAAICQRLSPREQDELAMAGRNNFFFYEDEFDLARQFDCDWIPERLAAGSDPQALLNRDDSYLAVLGQLVGPSPPAEGIAYVHQLQIVRGAW